MVNKKSKMQFDFDLEDYYDKETRLFEFPKGYVAFSLMSDVFIKFLTSIAIISSI